MKAGKRDKLEVLLSAKHHLQRNDHMRELLKQIEAGLSNNLYFLSLFVSLTIPDICAAMESANGRTTNTRYKAWFNKHFAPRNPRKYGAGTNFTADDCYNFRCAILHQGRTNNGKTPYKRIMFFEPGTFSIGLHSCVVGSKTKEKSLVIDVKVFCADMVQGAKDWIKVNENSAAYKTNTPYLVKRYPQGIPPVFGGPVIG